MLTLLFFKLKNMIVPGLLFSTIILQIDFMVKSVLRCLIVTLCPNNAAVSDVFYCDVIRSMFHSNNNVIFIKNESDKFR